MRIAPGPANENPKPVTARTEQLMFRLTAGELDTLKQACRKQGGRSLSSFTRAQLMHVLYPGRRTTEASAIPDFPQASAVPFSEQAILVRLEAIEIQLAHIASLIEDSASTICYRQPLRR